ncbi:MAG: heat-inducible transcription repressor HrcA [Clostridiales bacterium]|jgi:heat-inducible transcriptional repressor|nr:heat-inducible transcription repressor HrcA [Clostridiales bacterium]
MEISERKRKILAAIVEAYVKTGEPIGSKALCEALDYSVSSATIRNEMADLVELGLLEQPHTSAGRIPSHEGYRLYIDQLMHQTPLTEDEQRFIDGSLSASANDPEHLLEDASQILAEMTRYAAVSTTPSDEEATVRHLQLVQTGRRTAMVVMTTSSGMLKNKIFRCDYDLTPEILRIFHKMLNEKLGGIPVASITPAFIQTMAASLGEMTMLMPSVLMAVLEASREAMETDVRLEGQYNLLFLPEFGMDNARRLMEFLNQREQLIRLLEGQTGVTKVLIGPESEYPELYDSSLVVSRYSLGGKNAGAIGIIGPTRMDYAKMIPKLEYLASTVGTLLSEIMDME